MTQATIRRTTLLGAGATTAALLLTGCTTPAGESSDREQPDAGAPTEQQSQSPSNSPEPSPGQSGGGGDLSVETFGTSWQDAVAAAQQSFDGRLTSVELDRERSQYIYSVDLVSDTEEYEAIIDADSGEILNERAESLEPDDAHEVADEVFEVDGLIDPAEAIDAAVQEAEGTARSWSLDREWDGVFYEVEVALPSGDDTDVTVAATTGEVVEVD